MGFGGFIRRTAANLDSKARGIEARPFSKQSLTAAIPLAVGLPIDAAGAQQAASHLGGQNDRQVHRAVSQARHDKAIRQGIRDLKAPQQKKNRQLIGVVASYVGIVAVVAVVCFYSVGTLCAAAVTGGITAASLVNAKDSQYKAAVAARKEADRAAAAGAAPGDAYSPPGDSGVGGAAADLAAGDFSGVGDSLDWNTLAGKKTWLVLGASVVALGGLYYGLRYLRK